MEFIYSVSERIKQGIGMLTVSERIQQGIDIN